MQIDAKKLVLGTAQFGSDYGIANLIGQPNKKTALKILSLAWEYGVRQFDTAPVYGTEALLGTFVQAHGIARDVKILTKIPRIVNNLKFRDTVTRGIEESIDRLGCPIETLFFHNADDSILLLEYPDYFDQLIADTDVGRLGVSVYEPNEIDDLNSLKKNLAFQFPFNVIDTRFAGAKLPFGGRYARSVFLQGVLASLNSLREDAPKVLKEFQHNYIELLSTYNINPVEFATTFVCCSRSVDYCIFGVESLNQLENIVQSRMIDISEVNEVMQRLPRVSEEYIDPRHW